MDKASYASARAEVLEHYGDTCTCCGAREQLSIDKIDPDPDHHKLGGGGFYRWLTVRGFPPGYQTHCMRCNRSKGNRPACRLHHRAADHG